MWPDEETFIEEMVASGCVIAVEYGDDGPMLTWDMELTKELYPEVAEIVEKAFMEEVKDTLMDMVDDGIVDMSFEETEDGGIEEVFLITDKGKETLKRHNELSDFLFDTDDGDVVE